MSQWGSNDRSNNAPVWAPAQFNKAPNTANRDALYSNNSADAYIVGKTVGVFAAGANEVSYGHTNVYGVTSILVTAPGTGFQVIPTLTLANAAGDTTGANATATGTAKVVGATINTSAMGSGGSYIPGETLTIAGGTGTPATLIVANTAIRAAPAVTLGGNGYANGDTVSFADGVGTQAVFTVTTGAANSSVASLALTSNGSYTTNPTLTNAATVNVTGVGTGLRITANTRVKNVTLVTGGEYTALPSTNAAGHATANGSGAQTVLQFGLSHAFVTNAGAGYTKAPTVTVGGTGGSGATATANINPIGGDARGVSHTGWQLVTLGSGGRAGRVMIETLVAGGITTDNANDNPVFPN